MHKTVARNSQYRRGGLSIRQRHNERQNIDYMNDDIIKSRSGYNVYFKRPTGSYEQMFDAMVADKTISTRGLGKDPFIVDELVFDVNTAYFEERGGYEYAKAFYEEAYRCAVEEIGGEQYVLSAVMHADERNKALSEQYGYDVYHYHVHVVYTPVVDKEIYFKKNNKNPELAGKLREVIKQVSHSKKWPKQKQLDENGEIVRNAKGKAVLVNAYSLLQDHFCDHMREAGFDGFERGERGSTAEHLSVQEFKTKQEIKRADEAAERAAEAAVVIGRKKREAAELDAVIVEKEKTADELDAELEEMEREAKRLDNHVEQRIEHVKMLDKKLDSRSCTVASIRQINSIGNTKNMLGQIVVTPQDLRYLKGLACDKVKNDSVIEDYAIRVEQLEKERDMWKSSYEKLLAKVQPFLDAVRHAPKKVMSFIKSVMREPREKREQPKTQEQQRPAQKRETPVRRRSTGMEL